MLTIEEACLITEAKDVDKKYAIKFSNYGYVVDELGNVYSLINQFTHGLILALLYPDVFNAWRSKQTEYDQRILPDHIDDTPVRYFQDFELEHSGQLPVIRISGYRLLSGRPSIDKVKGQSINEQQTHSLREVFKVMGLNANSHIETIGRTLTLSNLWEFLLSDKSPYDFPDSSAQEEDYDD